MLAVKDGHAVTDQVCTQTQHDRRPCFKMESFFLFRYLAVYEQSGLKLLSVHVRSPSRIKTVEGEWPQSGRLPCELWGSRWNFLQSPQGLRYINCSGGGLCMLSRGSGTYVISVGYEVTEFNVYWLFWALISLFHQSHVWPQFSNIIISMCIRVIRISSLPWLMKYSDSLLYVNNIFLIAV